MLTNTAPSLSDIAIACGFADQSHFTRAFTREVGVSLGAWPRLACGSI
jgi:AraC-like DNA-binding protein